MMYNYRIEYVLDLTIDQVFMMYDYGIDFEKSKNSLLVSEVAKLFAGGD